MNISKKAITKPVLLPAPMASYHKPKMFRSLEGCCICKAKSSSSRFTDSGKYESSFENCFRLKVFRSGDICNACVLIVKRWRNLPRDTTKHWEHVVNSRCGPGYKVAGAKIKRTEEITVTVETFEKIRRKKKRNFVFKKPKVPSPQEPSSDIPGFINVFYWKRQDTCCGVIYEGQCGEVMIDQRYYKKCQQHSTLSTSSSPSSASSLPSSQSSSQSTPVNIIELPKTIDVMEYEEIKSFDEDSDTISFYSDDTESDRLSKLSKEDFTAVIDTDGDEGFYDKSETRRFS